MRDIGPFVLTRYEHNGVTEKFIIRPCCWQHNLQYIRPEHLYQSVIQPYILKYVKAPKYSTRYHIFYQSRTFNGIDTCSVTSYGNFDSTSNILEEYEAR